MTGVEERMLARKILTAIILRCVKYTYQIYGILFFAILVCLSESGIRSIGVFKDIAIVIASVSLILLYSYFLNCYADARMDAIGGKQLPGVFPKWILPVLAALCFGSGIAINGVFANQNLAYNIFYVASAPLGVLYSVEPFRLKTKGILGPIADLAEVTVPAALVFSYFGAWTYSTALFLLAFCAVNFIWILEHQLYDYDSDIASGEKTFAILSGQEKTRKTLASLYPIETALSVFLSIAVISQLRSGALSAAAFAGVAFLMLAAAFVFRKPVGDSKIGNRPSIHSAQMLLLLVVLPLILAIDLAANFSPYIWLVAGAALTQLRFYAMAAKKAGSLIRAR